MRRIAAAAAGVAAAFVVLAPLGGAQMDMTRNAGDRLVLPQRVATKNPRLESRLAAVASLAQRQSPASALAAARASGLDTAEGRIRVVLEAAPADARAAVTAAGGAVEANAGRLTEALVQPASLAALSRAGGVNRVRAPYAAAPLGTTDSQGVAATFANAWHTRGATGAGAKVAIIDIGFADYAARQAAGELPLTLVTVDYCGGATGAPQKHGTAVAEIVHEMAPDAQLTLICIDSEVGLANAEEYVKSHGITIVNHSVGWFNTSRGDGTGATGTPDAIVADARVNGILWVNAAGNSAQEHWSGTFSDSNANGLHDFAPGDEGNSVFLSAGEDVCAFLKWDAWPTTNQDFDLLLFRASEPDPVAVSANDQSTQPQAPTEALCYTNTTGVAQTFFFAIGRYSPSTAARLDLFVGDALQYQTPAGSIAEPASSPSAFAVGAICWQNDRLEPYSSRGPTIDGRVKPDIAGQDSVSSPLYGAFSACGSSGFAGTSASAPHVAGAAALWKGFLPPASVSEIQSALQADAFDLAPAGIDSSFGAGKLQLPTSMPTVATSTPSVVTRKTLRLGGSVDPRGLPTTYYWRYGTTTSYGGTTTPVSAGGGRTPQTYGQTVTDLAPSTAYHFQFVATNLFGTSYGNDLTATTLAPQAPSAVTAVPSVVGDTRASIAGSVNPNESATTYHFEYGLTTAYGTSTPSAQAGDGLDAVSVTETLTGLIASTAYHYRLVASNSLGTANGDDATFTSAAAPPSSGGGRGADVEVTFAASNPTPVPNESVEIRVIITNKEPAGATGLRASITLPAGTTLLGPPAFDRGSGCTGTTTLGCFLDYLPGRATTSLRFALNVGGAGAKAITAKLTLEGTDPDERNNSGTLTLDVKAPLTPIPTGGTGGAGKGSVNVVNGTNRANVLNGSARRDTIRGFGGNDRLSGRGGDDRLFGGSGNDRLIGGLGNDRLVGGPGRDILEGGPGDDVIDARDGLRDVIRCAGGRDIVNVDRRDRVARDCEIVRRR